MDDATAREIDIELSERLLGGSGELMNIAFGEKLYSKFEELGFIKSDTFKKVGFSNEQLFIPGYRGHVALLNRRIDTNGFVIGEGGYDAQGS